MLHNELAALCFPSTWLSRDDAALWSSFCQHVMIDLTGHSKNVWRKGSSVFMWSWVLVGDLCVYRGEEIISWCLLKLYFVYRKRIVEILATCVEEVVQEVVDGCHLKGDSMWRSLWLDVERPTSALGWPFLSLLHKWAYIRNYFAGVGTAGSFELDGDSLVESLTIESLIISGCGLEVCTKLWRVCLN